MEKRWYCPEEQSHCYKDMLFGKDFNAGTVLENMLGYDKGGNSIALCGKGTIKLSKVILVLVLPNNTTRSS